MKKKITQNLTLRKSTRYTTRNHRSYSAEENVRVVLDGLRSEYSIAEQYRREGINTNNYYRWSKEFLKASKKRLTGDTVRKTTSNEVKHLCSEARA